MYSSGLDAAALEMAAVMGLSRGGKVVSAHTSADRLNIAHTAGGRDESEEGR